MYTVNYIYVVKLSIANIVAIRACSGGVQTNRHVTMPLLTDCPVTCTITGMSVQSRQC